MDTFIRDFSDMSGSFGDFVNFVMPLAISGMAILVFNWHLGKSDTSPTTVDRRAKVNAIEESVELFVRFTPPAYVSSMHNGEARISSLAIRLDWYSRPGTSLHSESSRTNCWV